VLERLDRLTLDEARTTAAQTLEVVYCLVQNMRVVIDGEKSLRLVSCELLNTFPDRWQSIDGQFAGCAR
jgi:hypothetical protein